LKILTTTLVLLLWLFSPERSQAQNVMYSHYINVGQGSAVLVEFPCGAVLIDAGAQDSTYEAYLIDYLNNFFKERPDLERTIDLVIVTHAHVDHNVALDDVVNTFNVKRYIDNGHPGKGVARNQTWLQEHTEELGISYASYSFEEITADNNKGGLSGTIIDPIDCEEIDPQIILYSGSFETNTGWTKTDYNNENNHSVVVKVLFGTSSFLFTGDLEDGGIKAITSHYDGTDALDVDVMMVGHHGAENATKKELLDAVSPKYAVISCGKWDYGLKEDGTYKTFTTNAYGHPRLSAISDLEQYITAKRSKPQTIRAGVKVDGKTRKATWEDVVESKRIYCTPQDNTVIIRATDNSRYAVYTDR
jgi:competence protein ComEC